jgi:hypothetical protein
MVSCTEHQAPAAQGQGHAVVALRVEERRALRNRRLPLMVEGAAIGLGACNRAGSVRIGHGGQAVGLLHTQVVEPGEMAPRPRRHRRKRAAGRGPGSCGGRPVPRAWPRCAWRCVSIAPSSGNGYPPKGRRDGAHAGRLAGCRRPDLAGAPRPRATTPPLSYQNAAPLQSAGTVGRGDVLRRRHAHTIELHEREHPEVRHDLQGHVHVGLAEARAGPAQDSPCSMLGAMSSSALRYWLLMGESKWTSPPRSLPPFTR